MEAVVDKPHDRATLAAWLKTQMTLEPANRIRVEPIVAPDRRAHPGQDADTELLDAWTAGAWWYSRLAVEVYVALMPTGRQPRWLLLGYAHIGEIVEGTRPGQPFANCWEDMPSTWLDLAKAATNEAAETLETLQAVRIEWRSEPSPQTYSGS